MYTDEQHAAIKEALYNRDDTGFCDYEQSTGVIERGPQKFAVFGDIAYDISLKEAMDDEFHFEYIPVCVDGKYWVEFPDEGSSGVLYLMRCLKRRGKIVENPKWTATWINSGWLWTKELALTNAEIAKNIADDIDSGQLCITGGRPGWA